MQLFPRVLTATISLAVAAGCDVGQQPNDDAGAPEECTADGDCADGELCVSGVCEGVPFTVQTACNQDSNANANVETFELRGSIGDVTESLYRSVGNPFTTPLSAPASRGTQVSFRGWRGDGSSNPEIFDTPAILSGRTPVLSATPESSGRIIVGAARSMLELTDTDGDCIRLNNGESVAGRHGHTATKIPGTPYVLVAGGAVWVDDPQTPGRQLEIILRSAELWDADRQEFIPLPELPDPRAYHTATPLPDGTVLLAGGFSVINQNVSTLRSGVIVNPSAEPYQSVLFDQNRAHHTATYVQSENAVVLAGGCSGPGCQTNLLFDAGTGDPADAVSNVEVFDLGTLETVSITGLGSPRAMHAATFINGRVLLSGGIRATGLVCDIEAFEVLGQQAVSMQLPTAIAQIEPCRVHHQLTAVNTPGDSARLLLSGGYTGAEGGRPAGDRSATASLWNYQVGIEAETVALSAGRATHFATQLPDGDVVLIGGAQEGPGSDAERLLRRSDDTFGVARPMTSAGHVSDHAAFTMLADNQVFSCGGFDPLESAWTSSDRAFVLNLED